MKFLFEYRKGYFKAILDMKNFLESHTVVLKHEKINNAAGIIAILCCILTDLPKFMETAETTEFIVSKDVNNHYPKVIVTYRKL